MSLRDQDPIKRRFFGEGWKMVRSIGLFLGLAVVWLLLSGYFDNPLILSFGALSCVLTVWIAHRMDLVDQEGVPYHLAPRIIGYWLWLFREIVTSSIDVTKVAFSNMETVRPQIFRYRAPNLSEVGLVTLANSVTLTPGTVVLELNDDELMIHALTTDAADPEPIAEMDRRIEKSGANR